MNICRKKLSALRRHVARFSRATRGNFQILTAISIVPLLGITGLAIDYGAAISLKTRLTSACDAAVLDSIKESMNQILAGTDPQLAAGRGRARGIAGFRANAGLAADRPDPDLVMTATNISARADLDYTTSMPTRFARLIGIDQLPVVTQCSANQITRTIDPPYIRVALLLDISGSMAVGATAADNARLETAFKCGFACHDTSQVTGVEDLMVKARNLGIKLKIDYVRNALNTILSDSKNMNKQYPNRVELGIYTMGTYFTEVMPLTTYIETWNARGLDVDLEDEKIPRLSRIVNPYYDMIGYSIISDSIRSLANKLDWDGDGSTPGLRKNFAIIVSDGAEDVKAPYEYTESTGQLKQSFLRSIGTFYKGGPCDTLKQRASVFTIVTPYPVVDHSLFNSLVRPFLSTFAPAMEKCANGPKAFVQADDGPALEAAMAAIFTTVTQATPVRLTISR